MSCFQAMDELMQARARHMDNLYLLRNASSEWDAATAARGEATMANLMQQVYAIDDEMRAAGEKLRMGE